MDNTTEKKYQKIFDIFQNCFERFGFKLSNEINIVDSIGMIIAIVALVIVIWQSCQLQEATKLTKRSADLADSSFSESQKSSREESERAERTTKAMEKNIEIAEMSARVSNRAYISFKDVTKQILQVGKQASVDIKYVNVGKTPAYNISIIHGVKIGGSGFFDNEIENIKTTKITNQTLGASLDGNTTAGSGEMINYENFTKIMNGQKSWFVYGNITYNDIFGGSHFTRYCFQVFPDKNIIVMCDKYNDAN